jgi:hypothetical protein
MNTLRKFAAFAAASAALGAVTLGAGPAAAQNAILQGWRYNGNPAWADQQPYLGVNSGGYGAPGYYGGDGYAYGYGGPDAGGMTVAICPDGYRLGPDGRMCWPD